MYVEKCSTVQTIDSEYMYRGARLLKHLIQSVCTEVLDC